ncbi:shikimate kinase [Rhodosalinus halophilus]|uniref:Shikimate kinase n=1 Tax=Rhodosalinus halophilus TaxID=2259333 RepID=A0A365U8X7_9RHOB|nr:shikimate kinase [Rhodosalinus halophilus]RBI85112.1 shikimate kinase [Rhodosalinus halophilus]
MGWHLKKTVAMVGMMGAGKTAVGRAVAQRLGVPFLDSDAEIEAAANLTVAEIFARDGEAFFRAKESQVLRRLLAGRPCVLSTGGGVFLSEANRAAIRARGVAVWLRVDAEVLWARVRHKDTRPLLRTPDPRATLERLLAERAPAYAQADLIVEAGPACSIEETTERVIAALLTRPDVLEAR